MLAYYDGTRSLIPVKILSAKRDESGMYHFRVKSTAGRYGYPRGTEFDGTSLHVFPRKALSKRGGSWKILPYTWDGVFDNA